MPSSPPAKLPRTRPVAAECLLLAALALVLSCGTETAAGGSDDATEIGAAGDTGGADGIEALPDAARDPAGEGSGDASDEPAGDDAEGDTAGDTTGLDAAADTEQPDADEACNQCSALRPIILVHGINGAPENFDVMAARLLEDGWPAEWIVPFAAADPSWGCNVDNAAALAELVDQVMADTCQPRVDIVAHSMGSLSSRYYIKNLGGQELVNTYVTLGGMHHGLLTPCFAPDFLGVCVWQELCESGEFITDLNAEPATPGDLHWVSIYGTADTTVPNESSIIEGAENVAIEGAEHFGENGLNEREDAYAEILRVLGYDCW